MSVLFVAILLLLFVLDTGLSTSNALDPKYRTTCSISTSLPIMKSLDQECFVALFSYRNISFAGPIVYSEDNLCGTSVIIEEHWRETLLNQPLAVATKRGGCSFAEKARNAEAAGFKMVIVVNSEKQAFPVGPTAVEFPLTIPVLMAGSDISAVLQGSSGSLDSASGHQQLEVVIEGEGGVLEEELVYPAVRNFPRLSIQFVVQPETRPASNVPLPQRADPASYHRGGAELNANAISTLYLLVTVAAVAGAAMLVLTFWVALDPATAVNTHGISLPIAAPASFPVETASDVGERRPLHIGGPAVPEDSAVDTRRVAAESALWLGYLAVGALFVALRLGTLRVYSPAGSAENATGGDVYNHQETDERVFEALVSSVLRDWSDYRLHEATIQELGLARENYSDSLFIHPPVFVYLSAVLHRYVGVPLALAPLLLQVCTLALLPVILSQVLLVRSVSPTVLGAPTEHAAIAWRAGCRLRSAVAGLQAWVLFSCCPVAAFCSQKFWIDNCLMLSVTASVAAHVWLLPIDRVQTVSQDADRAGLRLRREGYSHSDTGAGRCVLSGAVFGAVAMNTKITAAALLPFAVCWIAARHVVDTVGRNHGVGESKELRCSPFLRVLSCTARDAVAYLLGAALTYCPWAYLYWVGRYFHDLRPSVQLMLAMYLSQANTGRLTPNAWPSAEMLQRSSFVRAAVDKPWHSYLGILAQCAPVHWVALLGGCVLAGRVVPSVLRALLSEEASGVGTAPRSGNGPSDGTALASAGNMHVPYWYLPLLALAVWPLGFLAALTFLGSLGSGFQSRFLTPMLPGSVLLTTALLDTVTQHSELCGYMRVLASTCSIVVSLLAAYSAAHALYYGVLYAPLFADLDASLIDVVAAILRSPYSSPASREAFQETLRFMAHYGLDRQSR